MRLGAVRSEGSDGASLAHTDHLMGTWAGTQTALPSSEKHSPPTQTSNPNQQNPFFRSLLEYVEWVANNPPVAYSLLLSTREHHATTMGRSYSNDGRGDEYIWVAAFEFDDITYMAIPGGDGGPRPGGRSTGAVFNHLIARVDAVTGDISGTALLRPWSPRPYPMTGEMPTPIPSP